MKSRAGVVDSASGKVYGIPYNAEVVLVIDPAHHSADTTTLAGLGATYFKWQTGAFGPDGKIYALPGNSDGLLVIE